MSENWKTYKLGDVAEIQNGFAFKSHDITNDGIPIIKIKNIIPPYVEIDDESRFDGIIDSKLEKYRIKRNDFLISMTGSTVNVMSSAVGKMGRYKYFEPALLNQRVGKIYVKNTFLLDKDFMYYYLNRYEIHYNLALNATGSANQANISPDQIKHIEITLPPLPEQTAIASILSALDDKIELNLQQNKTLEEIAMALYKNWFVDFGPFKDGKFIDSELGRIPEGWEVKKLGDFSIIIMGQSPKSEFYNSDRTGLPFHQGVKDFGERFPTDITYTTSGNKIAEVGEILFSVRAPVGRINIAKNKIVLGRGLASLKMKDGNGFLLYSLKNFFQKEDIIGSGTVFNSVNKTEIENIKFVKPNRELLIEFNKKITGIDELIYSNYLENENLKNLRDSLLPKLIIGEIRVKDNDH